MTNEWFTEVQRDRIEVVSRALAANFEHFGYVLPAAFLFRGDEVGHFVIIGGAGGDGDAWKNQLRSEIENQIKRNPEVNFVIFLAEAWVVKRNSKDDLPEGSIEHVPGRMEVAMMVAESNISISLGYAEMDRSGPKPKLKNWDWQKADDSDGRFTRFLPKLELGGGK